MDDQRTADAAVLSFLEDVVLGGAREYAVGVRSKAFVLDRFSQPDLFIQILIRRAQNRTRIHAQFAEHTGIVTRVDGFFILVVEDIHRANRHTGRAPYAFAGMDDFVHEHIDRLEPAAVEFRAPGIGPFIGVRALLDQRAIAPVYFFGQTVEIQNRTPSFIRNVINLSLGVVKAGNTVWNRARARPKSVGRGRNAQTQRNDD